MQVSIDANGLLKVTHLVPFTHQRVHAGGGGGAASSFGATPAMSAFGNTQQVMSVVLWSEDDACRWHPMSLSSDVLAAAAVAACCVRREGHSPLHRWLWCSWCPCLWRRRTDLELGEKQPCAWVHGLTWVGEKLPSLILILKMSYNHLCMAISKGLQAKGTAQLFLWFSLSCVSSGHCPVLIPRLNIKNR